jgi:hypothetical protein
MHRIDPETKAPRKVMDTISDNAANAALVVGGRPFRPQDADLRWIGALLFRFCVGPLEVRPSIVSKFNTLCQAAFIMAVVGREEFAVPPGWTVMLLGKFPPADRASRAVTS